MARGAEAAGTAGEHQEMFRMAVGTADAGKPAARVAAVEVALDDFFDDGPEEAVLLLETALILGQETIKVMKEHLVEDGALRMSGTVDSLHDKELWIKKRAKVMALSVSA
jgi:hypothetical protein